MEIWLYLSGQLSLINHVSKNITTTTKRRIRQFSKNQRYRQYNRCSWFRDIISTFPLKFHIFRVYASKCLNTTKTTKKERWNLTLMQRLMPSPATQTHTHDRQRRKIWLSTNDVRTQQQAPVPQPPRCLSLRTDGHGRREGVQGGALAPPGKSKLMSVCWRLQQNDDLNALIVSWNA